ncbi:MAG: cupin domain-containing protein [Pseudomonadota bacterium]
MEINADFSQRVVVKAAENAWVPSPMPGVERKMLDRIGDEIARATTIVRFAPGSHFSAHTHDGGEEFIVLDGVFQDEHGDFPAGSYIRNPPTSSHTPAAADGATILVKLHQFDPADRTHVRIATHKAEPVPVAGRDGVAVLPLFRDERETVRIEHWAPGAEIRLAAPGGMEVFVLEGGFVDGADRLGPWDWLRLPDGKSLAAKAGPEGARVWIKAGHLPRSGA